MFGIYRRFGSQVISKDNIRPVTLSGAVLTLNKRAELYCNLGSSSYIICDDVYAFAVDESSIWYSIRRDVECGHDIVYKLETHDVFCRKKGFFDKDNNFIYERDEVLYMENSSGYTYKLCSTESLELFLDRRKRKNIVSINQIQNILFCRKYLHGYSETDFFKDLNHLHMLIAGLSDEKNRGFYTSTLSAQIILKVIQMSSRMNKDVVKPLLEAINKEIYECGE